MLRGKKRLLLRSRYRALKSYRCPSAAEEHQLFVLICTIIPPIYFTKRILITIQGILIPERFFRPLFPYTIVFVLVLLSLLLFTITSTGSAFEPWRVYSAFVFTQCVFVVVLPLRTVLYRAIELYTILQP